MNKNPQTKPTHTEATPYRLTRGYQLPPQPNGTNGQAGQGTFYGMKPPKGGSSVQYPKNQQNT